ncbi:MAG: PEGA domain-containing protein, partial [Candidatus Omnitrophica bacterium]|nr:PEGA domain-containing protein [Candidatus Omnitrophota bacterium]
MLKKIRRTVFYTFVGIYLILAPLVILYAFGYIFNPANLKIIRTGIIYLSSAPAGASVYFGKSRYTKTTPVALRDLLPGKYTIRLSLNKYEPWIQNIKVAPGKATVFDRILLTPLERKAMTLTTKSYSSLIPLPGTDFIILSGGQKFRDYSVFDCVNEKYLPIFSEDSLLAETKVLHIYTIPQSPAFIIEGYLHGDKIYVWCKPNNGNIEIENITSLFPQKPLGITWNNGHTTHIFCVYEEYVSLLDITIKAIYPRYLGGLAGFGTNNNSIYELRKDGDFFKISYDKSHAKKIDYSPELRNILFRKPAFYNIDFLREDTFLFSENNGSL